MKTEVYGGHLTAWRAWPGGPGRALLVHCSLGHSGAWRGVAGQLAETHECRAFDLPGHGRSDPWDGAGVLQDAVCAQIRGMIADWTAPVDLIGHSFGATAALRIAATAPKLVRRLVLIEPVFFTPAYIANPAYRDRQMVESAPIDTALERNDFRSAAQAFLKDWGGGEPWEAMSEAQQTQFSAQMPLIKAAYVTNNGDPDRILADGHIARMAMPTLLIDGSESPEGSHEVVTALRDLIANAKIETVQGAGHMVPVSHAGETGTLIKSFLG